MALNLNLSGRETTDFTQIILTDVTEDWGVGGNINFTDVLYAEMYLGFRGALYGPVVLTDVFAGAVTQNDLVFVFTTSILGIEDSDTFDDALQTYEYGLSDLADPPHIQRNVWPLQLDYTLPIGDTENKIPFSVEGRAVRSYILKLTITLHITDEGVNPQVTLNVNYLDGTKTEVTQAVPQDGSTNIYTLTATVDRTKQIGDVTGFLLDEDRSNISGRSGTITDITLNEDDLDLISVVKRGLVAEKSKKQNNKDLIDLKDKILCGSTSFDEHERIIVRDMALRSATSGASQGLTNNVEETINFLNEDC